MSEGKVITKPRAIPLTYEWGGKVFIIWEDIDNKFFRACEY